MDIFQRVKELNFPSGHYVVVGGGVMEAHGLRTAGDLDIVANPQLFVELKERGWEIDNSFKEKFDRVRLKYKDVEIFSDIEGSGTFIPVQEFIDRAEFIHEIPFMDLEELLGLKRYNGREKDANDIVLIEEYLKTNS